MSLNYTSQRILSEGLDMAIIHCQSEPSMIARLRGALAYNAATGAVLRDELLEKKTPSAPWIESIPAMMAPTENE